MSALQVHANDNVGVALTDLEAATEILGVTLQQAIPKGHKFALRAIASGDACLLYTSPSPRDA